MTPTDPPRLFDLEGTPAELRSLIGMAREDLLDEAAAARVAAAVQAGIGGGPLPHDPSGGAPSAAGAQGGATAAGAKLAAAIVAATVVAGGVWYAAQGRDVPDGAPGSSRVSVVEVAPASPTASSDPTDVEDASPAEASSDANCVGCRDASTPTGAGAAGAGQAGRPVPESSDRAPSPADLAEEHRLLRGARAALESDPRRALALAAEHKRRFPNGVLTQEREVIAIEALARLGQDDAARARADRFSTDFPDSPHRDRVGGANGAPDPSRP